MGGSILIERIILFMKGYVKIFLWGNGCHRFFNLCVNHGMELRNMSSIQNGYQCYVALKDVYSLKPLARKCHVRFRIKEKYGFPFFIKRHRKRKVFVLGIACCVFFIYWFSVHIWNIQISGSIQISRPVFLEYLKTKGVGYGTRKKEIDCKELADEIRSRFTEFSWVSVKIKGTGMVIDVQEMTDAALYEKRTYEDSNLVSDVQGIVVKMVTRSGTPLVKVGDTIAPDQILVLGRNEITDDDGNVVNYQYCAADADIYVKTVEKYENAFPLEHNTICYTGKMRTGFYLNLGGKVFGCCPFLNQLDVYEVMQKEKQLCLWQDFYLPVSFGKIKAREYEILQSKYTENEAISLAESKLHKFLLEKEQKGVQIFEKNVKIHLSATLCLAKGTITFIEKTGNRVGTEYIDLQQENDVS